MSTMTNALAVALILGSLTACQPDDETAPEGGGGGRTVIDRDELPDSNNVNPSPHPDTFIEPENRGKMPTP